MPNATLNRWIVSIIMFHFTLYHVPASFHSPDGLSRRGAYPGDLESLYDPTEFEDWIDKTCGMMHLIQPTTLPLPMFPYAPSMAALDTSLTSTFAMSFKEVPKYSQFVRKASAPKADQRMELVAAWLRTTERPTGMSDEAYEPFLKYALQFFIRDDVIYKKDPQGQHKVYIPPEKRVNVLVECHDHIGHRGTFATKSNVALRFWWPHFAEDVHWYVRSCHLCQERKLARIHIPPTVPLPAPPFARVHIDVGFMPFSMGKHLLIQARCSVTSFPEAAGITKDNADIVGKWIEEHILCRYGMCVEIITDNGGSLVKAMGWLEKHRGVKHIRISGYNSRANGIVEHGFFDLRQILYKLADGDEHRWMQHLPYALWAERVTPRKRLGCSPYFALTGCHPVLPLDIIEATFLIPPPTAMLTTVDLIARRAAALQRREEDLAAIHSKVYAQRNKNALIYERDHAATLQTEVFAPGELVLMRNTTIEKALNRKMRPRYLGPLISLGRNKGGAYILAELDGAVLHRPIAAFRVYRYFARKSIPIPENLLDVTPERLRDMMDSDTQGDDDPAYLGPPPVSPSDPELDPYAIDDDDVAVDYLEDAESYFLTGDGQNFSWGEDDPIE
ncbi:hypothetical protein EUX98_g6785 [Antrodiella citrinella]|uniref:Integrase catalytic domain-containing protein n=1 Tax=Antrodiella citrinella TaxID=2447956 RepID=A0A4S4MPX4_9APHY|nr:hypothetical protein EUX98_g6785 [Antrodiella citrinella]